MAVRVFSGEWHGPCINQPNSPATVPANAASQDGAAAGIGVGLLVGARVPGLESTDCPQGFAYMLNAQADTKATSTAESKPDQRAKEQGRANTAAAASAVAGTPNGKPAKNTTTHPAKPPAPVKSVKKRKKKNAGRARIDGERKRGRKPYPIVTFTDVLPLAEGIFTHSPTQPVKRATLLGLLGKDANTDSSRLLIINSGKYGLTSGGKDAEFVSLTPRGLLAVNTKTSRADRLKARFELAIGDVEAFKLLYEKRKGNNMPAPAILHDDLQDLDSGDRKSCADVFTSNVKFLGMLVPRDGAEYLMTLEEWLGSNPASAATTVTAVTVPSTDGTAAALDGTTVDYDKVCFIVSVIKDANSPERTHADAILNQYIEKSLDGTGLKAVRADKIGEPGMISRQIIEYVIKSKLVVVDLSFHNPNVFYELALRHVTGKPTVQVTRKLDPLPFDVGNARTILIDTSDGYTMVRDIDTIRSLIATAIRSALANGESRDNPILTYCPNAKFIVDVQ